MSRFTHRAFLPLTLPLLLLACGQNPTASQEDLGPYANGASYPWSYTQAPGTVTPLTLDPGRNNLYYEPILSAKNGWGPIEVNTSNGEQNKGDGRKLSVGGKSYDVGYGVHADSELRWSLKSSLAGVTCSKLDGYVGVDDEVGDRGSVTFQIFLDGAKVFDSGLMTGKDGAKFYSVDTTGKTDLRLVVTNGGDNNYYDHANWIQPTVHCQQDPTAPTTTPGSPDFTFGDNGRVPAGGMDSVFTPDGSIVVLGAQFNLTRLNANGKVTARSGPLGIDFSPSTARTLAVQPDGKLLAAGGSSIVRYNADLTLDTTFADGGHLDTRTLNATAPVLVNNVRVSPNGRILLVGQADRPRRDSLGGTSSAFAVLRLNTSGSPDGTFGQNGEAYVQYEDVHDTEQFRFIPDAAQDILVQPDGRLVVAGATDLGGGDFFPVAFRLTPTGQLDPTFGSTNNGFVTPQDLHRNYGLALAALPDGQIVLVAGSTRSIGVDPTIVRLSASGIVTGTKTFRFPFTDTYVNNLSEVAVQKDGKILIGGFYATQVYSSGTQFGAVARLNPDLTFDMTFGSGGAVALDVPGQSPTVRSLLIQADGRIVGTLATSDEQAAQTIRLNP